LSAEIVFLFCNVSQRKFMALEINIGESDIGDE